MAATQVRFEAVSKSYDGKLALKDLSFEIPKGVIFGCVGPNGAGKTTIVRLILGLLTPDNGSVEVFGRAPATLTVMERRAIGYCLEAQGLYRDLTVRENLQFYARIYGIKHVSEAIERIVAELELSNYLDKLTAHLSRGMRQRLAIHCAMMPAPRLLVLDEPTAGLDPIHQREIRHLLNLYRASGNTVFLCSHDLTQVERLCDLVLFLNNGECLAVKSAEEIANQSHTNVWMVRAASLESKQLLMARLSAKYGPIEEREKLSLVVEVSVDKEEEFFAFLSSNTQSILEIRRVCPTLEEVFFKLMGTKNESRVGNNPGYRD